MIHHHGTPITPRAKLLDLSGRNFCVSYAAPDQVETCHKIGQSVMLDNGAFSFWRSGKATDWDGYYAWCEPWLDHRTTWAVIPDVIDGTEDENDRLWRQWPLNSEQSAPVWHMHESLDRLEEMAQWWPKVCIGSSGQFAELQTPQWHRRMEQVFNRLCPTSSSPSVHVHMLRGMALSGGPYPFASVDSTDIAQNHHRPQNDVAGMALRWDSMQCPARWTFREQLAMETAA